MYSPSPCNSPKTYNLRRGPKKQGKFLTPILTRKVHNHKNNRLNEEKKKKKLPNFPKIGENKKAFHFDEKLLFDYRNLHQNEAATDTPKFQFAHQDILFSGLGKTKPQGQNIHRRTIAGGFNFNTSKIFPDTNNPDNKKLFNKKKINYHLNLSDSNLFREKTEFDTTAATTTETSTTVNTTVTTNTIESTQTLITALETSKITGEKCKIEPSNDKNKNMTDKENKDNDNAANNLSKTKPAVPLDQPKSKHLTRYQKRRLTETEPGLVKEENQTRPINKHNLTQDRPKAKIPPNKQMKMLKTMRAEDLNLEDIKAVRPLPDGLKAKKLDEYLKDLMDQ